MRPWDALARDQTGFAILNFTEYQLTRAVGSGKPILNAAAAGDLPHLGEFGAINLDVRPADHLRRLGMQIPLNYREGSVFDIPFADGSFKTVVLGEFLEHCTEAAASQAVRECARVLASGGNLIITVPLDGRPNGHNRPGAAEGHDIADMQCEPEMAALDHADWSEGVTAYHQTWWSNEMLHRLRERAGLVEVERVALFYAFTAPIGGWAMTWHKP